MRTHLPSPALLLPLGFLLHDSLMKDWAGSGGPLITHRSICAHTKGENAYNHIKAVCFPISIVYSDVKLTVSRHDFP